METLMASIEADALKGMLQVIEHLVDDSAKVGTAALQMVNAQKAGKPLAPATLAHYEQELEALTKQREHMRTLIAQWWTLLEGETASACRAAISEQLLMSDREVLRDGWSGGVVLDIDSRDSKIVLELSLKSNGRQIESDRRRCRVILHTLTLNLNSAEVRSRIDMA
jgi:hypothetical protein